MLDLISEFDFSIFSEYRQYDIMYGAMCWLPTDNGWDIFNVVKINYDGKHKDAKIVSWDGVRYLQTGEKKLPVRDHLQNLPIKTYIPLSAKNTYYLAKEVSEGEYVQFVGTYSPFTIYRKDALLVFKADRSQNHEEYKKKGLIALSLKNIRHKFEKSPLSGEFMLPKTTIL